MCKTAPIMKNMESQNGVRAKAAVTEMPPVPVNNRAGAGKPGDLVPLIFSERDVYVNIGKHR